MKILGAILFLGGMGLVGYASVGVVTAIFDLPNPYDDIFGWSSLVVLGWILATAAEEAFDEKGR